MTRLRAVPKAATPAADELMDAYDPNPPSRQAVAGLDLPDGYVIPAPFVLEADGVFVERPGPDKQPLKTRVTWEPLLPVRVYSDPVGDQVVELAWRDRAQWVHRLVPKGAVKSGRKLVAMLGDAGLPFTEADAKSAERWLAAAEAANRDVIPRVQLARRLGWQEDGEFVTSADHPYAVEPKYDEQRGALRAHHPHGTLAGWQAAIAPLADFPTARVGLYGGLAAPLLHVLGLDSITVDISGRSTRGKTIAVMCGASCWFDPSEQAEGMFHWRTTMIAVEKRLNLVNGLPVVIDETRAVKTPELVDNVLYQVPKNHGTPRGGGYPSLLPWRTIVLSTGEQPALTFTTHEGASARVLSVRRPPFGTDGAASAHAAGTVREGVHANYGTAGPLYVTKLRAELATDGGHQRLRDRHKELTEQFRCGSDIAARRSPHMACLYLAAELATEWGIVPFAPPSVAEWLDLFNDGDQSRNDNRPEMALDVVREYVASNETKFYNQGPQEPAGGWIGKKTVMDGENVVALFPEKVREALGRSGVDLDAVIPGWRELGALAERDKQRPPWNIPLSVGGHKVKLLVFRNLDDVDACDDE